MLRFNGRHLWNPTNFGVSAAAFLAPATVTVLSIQWGNVVAPMAVIWMLGSVIVWRVGRAHISATYVASFLLFSFVRSSITGMPWLATVAPITGPMYQLFIFFMVTDPKTTVRSKGGQCVVVFLVAFVEMLLRLNESPLRALLRALHRRARRAAGGDLAGVAAVASGFSADLRRRTARRDPVFRD